MDTVVDLLDMGHPDDDLALRMGRRRYEYHRFRATAYKTANYLRYNGVGPHATVSLLDEPAPETVFGLLGTALLGGSVRVAPEEVVNDAVLFGPTEGLDEYDAEGGCKRIAFGAEPADPSWAYFEREIWSENPFFPKTEVDPEVEFVGEWSQRGALAAAESIAADLSTADRVAIRGSFTDPAVIVAGVLAPLVAGATVLLPDADRTGTVAVGAADPQESRTLTAPDHPTARE
ncbi:MAG: hypothetical protein ACOCSN_02130 [Halanaeroarchaeum sp.]